MAMELFRRRVRSCLLVLVAVLVIERAVAKPGDQLEASSGGGGSAHSLPAEQPGHGRTRHDHKPQHDHNHDHRQAQRARHARSHRRPQPKHQLDEGSEPPPQQHALSPADEVAEAHDLLYCEPQPGDRLLARSVVKAEFRPLAFAEASWFFPQNGRDDRTIHCVRVLDQRRDGYGGYPSVTRGGVGHHYVELAFKSDFSRGFHFVVEVYGQ